MKLLRAANRMRRGSLRIVFGVVFGIMPILLRADAPDWWTSRGVLNTNSANDYAAVNQGQVKNIATAAYKELERNLPGGVGDMTPPDSNGTNAGTGYNLSALIGKWSDAPTSGANPIVVISGSTTNDYAAVNLGQLKSVAKPFYDRLLSVGYQGHPLESGTYPWINGPTNDYAMANIGQVKNLFSFDISALDTDHNGLSDKWEIGYFGQTGIDPSADPDEDGVTNGEEFARGTDPTQSVDLNSNGLPDDWETFHANSFAVWPAALCMQLARLQSGTQTLILNNSTSQPIQYNVSLTNNMAAGFVYSYLDSKTGGVPYTWEDISTTGTRLTNGAASDDDSESINLIGFSFPFYGQNYSTVYVCSNGLLSFGNGVSSTGASNFPSNSTPFNVIAALWCDLYPPGGAIYYKELSGRLIVQYENVPTYRNRDNQSERYTFQIVLFNNGFIELRYSALSGTSNPCAVGMKNADGSDWLQIADDRQTLENNLAIRISPLSAFIETAQFSGTAAAGAQTQLGMAFHARRLSLGRYTANIQITPNAGTGSLNIPATLEVINQPSQVAITSPTNGFAQLESESVTLMATATDTDTTIQKVEFYDGVTKISESTQGDAGRYTVTWNGLTVGSHLIAAKAIDHLGQVTASDPITIMGLQDTDRDGMLDSWETAHGLNPNDPSDASADPDGDGLTSLQEYLNGTNPLVFTQIRITQPSANQVFDKLATVPMVAEVAGVVNITDVTFYMHAGTSQDGEWLSMGHAVAPPYQGAIDYIGYGDYTIKAVCRTQTGAEITSNLVGIHVNNPEADEDQNGLPDAWEMQYFGNLGNGAGDDPDGDGVTNLEEYRHGSNPSLADTDADGTGDGGEVAAGSNPSNASSTPSNSSQIAVDVGVSDLDVNDDVWGVRMQIADEDGSFGEITEVVDNESCVSTGTATKTVYVPTGRQVQFTLRRIEANQYRIADEYNVSFKGNGLIPYSNNSVTSGSLAWTGSNGDIPPDPSNLKWTFTSAQFITPAGDPVNVPLNSGDGQNEFTYNDGTPGVLTISLVAKVTGLSNVDSSKFKFSVDNIEGSTKAWTLDCPDGKANVGGDYIWATVTFTTLPSSNSAFGTKKAKILYDGSSVAEQNYEVFFKRDEKNHPGTGAGTTPNWYYYWKDGNVCGIDSNCVFDDTIRGWGETSPGTDQTIKLSQKACGRNFEQDLQKDDGSRIAVGGTGTGIQCVAETIQHERKHLAIYNDFKILIGSKPANDLDGDAIPRSSEANYGNLSTDPNNPDTYNAKSIDSVYASFGDNEIRAMKAEETLVIPLSKTSDWSNPGCQSYMHWGPW